MNGELVMFPQQLRPTPADLRERMQRLVTLFSAIEAGELLAALPECPVARENHRIALHLLSMVEVEINTIFLELAS